MEKTVYFLTSDGIKLCGTWTLPEDKTDTCVILCHGIGYGRNVEEILPGLAKSLAKQGFAVFRFDFRGHGDSAGEATEFTITGQLKDIKAATVAARAIGYKKLGLAGASFGGGAAALFAARNPKIFRALALINPVIDYDSLLELKTEWSSNYFGPQAIINLKEFGFTKVGSHGFKMGKKFVDQMKVIKPWRELKKIKIPVLFVHGDADKAVPAQDSIKYSKGMENATLVLIAGGGHGLYDSPAISKSTIKTITKFLVKNLL